MVQNKKARVEQQTAKTESFEELIRKCGEQNIRKFGIILSEALQLKEQRLKVTEAEREKLSVKVDSLETQAKNDKNRIKKLERKVGQIFKLLLLERNKVKHLEGEISILKLDTVHLQADIEKEIESFTEDEDTEEPNRGNPDVSAKSPDDKAKDDDSDAVEESEDESDEDEPTEDNERVIVKKEVTSDNEDEDRSSTPTMRTEEKLLTESQAEEDGDADDADDDAGDCDREDLDDLLTTAIASFGE